VPRRVAFLRCSRKAGNLVAVATETKSPAVVLNFIRYQMGRDDKKSRWSSETDKQRLGDRFLAALHDRDGAVSKAFDEVKGKVPSWGSDARHDQLVRMEVIRFFLGFATRYMKYLELKYGRKENRS
jgi:hypothetical protein